MEINQLQYFLETCNCGSFTKAALKVHITQQGLSSSIRRLETELGCDLFYRKAGSLVLTDAGVQVYKEAQKLLKHMDNIHDICSNYTRNHAPLRIVLSYSILPRLSPKVQNLLLSNNVGINISLKENYSVDCVEAIENDDADFAIIYGVVSKPDIELLNLDCLKQVFIVNRQHHLAGRKTVSLEDLDALPFIAPEEPSYPRQCLNDMFKEKNLTLNVAYSCGRPRQVLDIISNNPALISRVVESEITPEDRKKISVLELEDSQFELPISLLYKKSTTTDSRAKAFISYLSESYNSKKIKERHPVQIEP